MSVGTNNVGISENKNSPFQCRDNMEGKFYKWTTGHPTIAKTALFSLAIIFSPVVIPTVTVASIVLFAKGISNGYKAGETVKKIGGLYRTILDILVPIRHDMAQHVFQEGKRGNAELKYEGDLPVLTLSPSDDPESLGRDYGYLLGIPLQKFLEKWESFLWVVIPSPAKAPQLCKNLKTVIPKTYLKEMEGITEGFNEKMQEIGSPKRLTLDQLLLFHLVPDLLHSQPKGLEGILNSGKQQESNSSVPLPPFGCTTILDYDENGHVVFGRNMDWPSLSVTGTYTFMLRRQYKDKSILEIGTPGLVGTGTAMNSKGLALAMNVCKGETQNAKGLPACIFNRMCIEECDNIDQLNAFIQGNSLMGPYHLSSADSNNAQAFHFYQGEEGSHVKRVLKKGQPVVTTNCRYNQKGFYRHYFSSKERHENIQAFYDQEKLNSQKQVKWEQVKQALSLPIVNNMETVHHVIMQPEKGIMSLRMDNAFAGSDSLLHDSYVSG